MMLLSCLLTDLMSPICFPTEVISPSCLLRSSVGVSAEVSDEKREKLGVDSTPEEGPAPASGSANLVGSAPGCGVFALSYSFFKVSACCSSHRCMACASPAAKVRPALS